MTIPIQLVPFHMVRKEEHPFKKDGMIITILGGVGSGKSTVLANLLNELSDEVFSRAIIMSANRVDPLLDGFTDQVEIYGCDKDRLHKIIAEIQQGAIEAKKSKKKIPKTLLVLDDCASESSVFSTSKTAFNSFVLSCRHYNTTLIFTTQKLKQVPPIIRVNTMIWFVTRLAPEEKKQLFKELPFPANKLEKAYDLATVGQFGWLQINVSKKMLIKDFSTELDL